MHKHSQKIEDSMDRENTRDKSRDGGKREYSRENKREYSRDSRDNNRDNRENSRDSRDNNRPRSRNGFDKRPNSSPRGNSGNKRYGSENSRDGGSSFTPRVNSSFSPRRSERPSHYQERQVPFSPLFARPDEFTQSALIAIGEVIEETMNQSAQQKTDLKYAIKDLSAILTNERTELVKPYWTSSRLIAAYTSFFMPWNLVRLTQLFPYLELPEVEDDDYVVDIGSGTLTAILALWMSRPDYREKKLTIIATDVATKPMEIGKEIFFDLATKLDIKVKWNIILEKRHTLQTVKNNGLNVDKKPKLLISANVLNELETKQHMQRKELNEFFFEYTENVKDFLDDEGAYLAVEPGTRQGGRIISALRSQALINELYPYAPCPHHKDCAITSNYKLNTWCHMQCPSYSPTWLKEVSRAAQMERNDLNLSFVFLKPENLGEYTNVGRVISNSFFVPELGKCRYLCTDRGTALLPNAGDIPHSVLVPITLTTKRDAKSNAFIAKINYDA